MTDERSETETACELPPFPVGGERALILMNGVGTEGETTRRVLRNKRTGELFFSYCSRHFDWNDSCPVCRRGSWAYYVPPPLARIIAEE